MKSRKRRNEFLPDLDSFRQSARRILLPEDRHFTPLLRRVSTMKSHRSIVVALALAGALGASGLQAAEKPSAGKGAATFELFKDKSGAFRFRLKGDDGTILAMSAKGLRTKADVQKVVDALKRDAGKAKVTGLDDRKIAASDTAGVIEIYKDKSGGLRFRIHGADGLLAIASKGYKTKADCQAVIDAIRKGAAKAKVEDDTK
jgi:uncharacterized protein YegP (UPF0339 family)